MSDLIPSAAAPGGEFLLYQTEDGRTRLEVRVQQESVWLSLNPMAELFQRDKSVISRHINNVFDEGELRREATVAKSATVQTEGGKSLMGLRTTRPGGIVRREDVVIAKNYLDEDELQTLNRIVNAYIEFAELQARRRRVMTMRDWIAKLDEFLKLSDFELLDHAGKISAEAAKAKAEMQYERYRVLVDSQPRPVDADFEAVVKELKKLPASSRKKKKS